MSENAARTVSFYNLGCKVNAYEVDTMAEKLKSSGYEIRPFGETVDVTIVNTCTVTTMADHKSRQTLHRARKISPEGVIVGAGCYVQVMDEEAKERVKDIDLLIGNQEKQRIDEVLEEFFSDRRREQVEPMTNDTGYEDLSHVAGDNEASDHTRAYLKIQDGCNQFCSYCIIPYARGRVRSKSMETIREELAILADSGIREIVLTGIHVSSYGVDRGETLGDLLKAIRSIFSERKMRLRFSSLEPRLITRELLDILRGIDTFCPHFHLSLQSGCDKTLREMNRKYTTDDYRMAVQMIREVWPDAGITTDVIVGFPGETEEDFEKSHDFVEEMHFAKTHIFQYAKRNHTPAAKRPDQIEGKTKAQRSEVLRKLDERRQEEFRSRFMGREVEVLIEESKEIDGNWYDCGYTREYLYVRMPIEETEKDKRRNQIVTTVMGDAR